MLKKFWQYVWANLGLVASRTFLSLLFLLFIVYPLGTLVYHSYNGDVQKAAVSKQIHGRLSGSAIYNCADKTLEAAENVQYKNGIPQIEEKYLREIITSYNAAIEIGTKHGLPELKWVESKLAGILEIEKAQNEAIKKGVQTVLVHPSCWDEYPSQETEQSGGAYR